MAPLLKLKHSDRWRGQFGNAPDPRLGRIEWLIETFESGTVGADWSGHGVDPFANWENHSLSVHGGLKVQNTTVESGIKGLQTNQAGAPIGITPGIQMEWGILTQTYFFGQGDDQLERISFYIPATWPGPTLAGSNSYLWIVFSYASGVGWNLMGLRYKCLDATWQLASNGGWAPVVELKTGIAAADIAAGAWHALSVRYKASTGATTITIDGDADLSATGTTKILGDFCVFPSFGILVEAIAAPVNDMPDLYFDNGFFGAGEYA